MSCSVCEFQALLYEAEGTESVQIMVEENILYLGFGDEK
jgi:hypothetical protein